MKKQHWKNSAIGERITLSCLTIAGLLSAAAISDQASAQIVFDGTVGSVPPPTLSGPDYAILESYGTQTGSVLLHSFEAFGLAATESATFSGNATIVDIVSRVTGDGASLIDGRISSSIDGANFWFINPNGVMLGPDSHIDVAGTFNVGAADYVSDADDIQYSAIDGTVNLAIANPVEFGFLDAGGGTGDLTLNDVSFTDEPGLAGADRYSGLGFAGRNVTFTAGSVHSYASDLESGDIAVTGHQITLSNSSLHTVPTGSADSGDIMLSGINVDLAEGSSLETVSEEDFLGNSGSVTINATGNVNSSAGVSVGVGGNVFLLGPIIDTSNRGLAAGSPGDISITAGSITLNDAFVFSATQSNAPNITASAIVLDATGGSLTLNDTIVVTSTSGITDGGSITLVADDVALNGSILSSLTEDQQLGLFSGAAGTITVTGTASVTASATPDGQNGMPRQWAVIATSQLPRSGQAADVTIQGGRITLNDGSIESTTDSDLTGQVRQSILIDAADNDLTLSNVTVNATTQGLNDAGSITLSGANVLLQDGSTISSNAVPVVYPTICGVGVPCTEFMGAAGEILITGDSVNLVNSTVSATTESQRPDNLEAAISVVANGDLSLTSSNITSTTSGRTDAGIIDLNGATIRLLNNSSLESTSGTSDTNDLSILGAAGVIDLDAGTLVELTDSSIATNTISGLENVNGGWIGINVASGDIRIVNSPLAGTTSGASEAGYIELIADNIEVIGDRDDATIEIQTSTTGSGNAGVISIGGGLLNTNAANTIRLVDARIASTSNTSDSGAAGVIDLDGSMLIELTRTSIGTDTDSNTFTPELDPTSGEPIMDPETNEEVELVGWININAPIGALILDDSILTSETSGQSGAGYIDLNVGSLQLLNASVISTEAFGEVQIGQPPPGNSGGITITVANDARIVGSPTTFSGITTRAAESEGGSIELSVGGRLDMDVGLIEANAGADGTGGSVTIAADNVLMQESGILARAEDGDGGAIFLEVTGANELFVFGSESLINADSDTGNAGEIDINTPDVDLDSALQEQDANIVAPPQFAADACSPSASGDLSTFVQVDNGGTPVAPDRYLTANVQTDVSAGAAAIPPVTSDVYSSGLLAAVQANPSEACR